MTPEQWQRIQEVFWAALDLEAGDRDGYLDVVCGGDPALREEVASLLRAAETSGPVDELAARLVAPLLPTVPADPAQGARVGPYRVLRKLGEGGMGVVYLAERADGHFEQQVALKLVRSGVGAQFLLHRFLNERQILARLVHPNIARLYDGGFSDGQPYFAMEYVEGMPIDRYGDVHRLGIDARLRLFCEVCAAVHYAHQNLVVHRDLKPSNILVTEAGEVKLLDFGIAKLLEAEPDAASSALTQTGLRVMTPEYASPEQVRGEVITTATDVYALGIVLYELLTGHRPYQVTTLSPSEVERVICEEEPKRPSTAVTRVEAVPGGTGETHTITPADVSRTRGMSVEKLQRRLAGDLDTIVLKALQKEPARRYASAGQLLEDIERHLAGLPVSARPDTVAYRAATFVRRHRVGVAAAVLVVVSLLGGLAGTAWQARLAAHERDQARLEAVKAEQVASFLEELFSASDPLLVTETEQPDTLRVRDFLTRGAGKVQRDLQDQPAVQARMLNVVGDVYRSLGLYDEARPLLEQALTIRREVLGPTHPEVAESLHSLAVLLYQQGDYEGSDERYQEALSIQRPFAEAQQVATARTLADLALLLRDLGRFEEAERLLREALAIRRARLGHEHLDVATTLMQLGTVLHYRADLDGAEPFYREALSMHRKLLGEDHPHVAQSLLTTGALMREKGDYEAAEPLLREALALRRRTLGEAHPLAVEALYELALLLRDKGDPMQAAPLFRQVIALDRSLLGPDHQYVGLDLFELGITLSRMEDFEGAEQAYREALVILRGALPGDHPSIAHVLNGLGYNYVNKGAPEEGEPLLREALQIYQQALGEEAWRTGVAQSALGYCLMQQGRLAEAEPLLVEGYATLRDSEGPVRAALERLALFYERQGQQEKAAHYRALLAGATH